MTIDSINMTQTTSGKTNFNKSNTNSNNKKQGGIRTDVGNDMYYITYPDGSKEYYSGDKLEVKEENGCTTQYRSDGTRLSEVTPDKILTVYAEDGTTVVQKIYPKKQ